MKALETVTLKSILVESKDGEWGQGEPSEDTQEMVVIRGTDFNSVRVGALDKIPIRHVKRRIAERKTLTPHDIIIETAGGSKDRPTGRTLYLNPSLFQRFSLPATCASFSRFLRINPVKADPKYIFWLLQHFYAVGKMSKYHTQHTGVARFQFTVFAESEPLPIPPKSTQTKIAAILSSYDELIESNTRRIKILEEMAQTIYREWFVNLRFPGHEKVKMVDSPMGKIPEGWGVKLLKDICENIDYGYTTSAKREEVGPKFLRITDIVPNLIDWNSVPYCEISEKDLPKYLLKEGDIVIARTGATTGYSKRINKLHFDTVFASYLVRIRIKSCYGMLYVGLLVSQMSINALSKQILVAQPSPKQMLRY